MRVELPPIEVTVRGQAELIIDEVQKRMTLSSELWCQTGIPMLKTSQTVPINDDLAAGLLSDKVMFEIWIAELRRFVGGQLMDDSLAEHALHGVAIALQLLPPPPKRGRPKKETKAIFVARAKSALVELDAKFHFRTNNFKPTQKQWAAALWPERDIHEAASYLRLRMREHGIKAKGRSHIRDKNHQELLRLCGYGWPLRKEGTKRIQ